MCVYVCISCFPKERKSLISKIRNNFHGRKLKCASPKRLKYIDPDGYKDKQMNTHVRWRGGGGTDGGGMDGGGTDRGGEAGSLMGWGPPAFPQPSCTHKSFLCHPLLGTGSLVLISLVSASLTPSQGSTTCCLLWEVFLNS